MADNSLAKLRLKLAEERERLERAAAAFSETELEAPYAGGWSAKDMLAHVAFAERVNVRLARAMLDREHPSQLELLAGEFPDYRGEFSLDSFNAYMADRLHALPLAQVLSDLHTARAETLAWLDSLSEADLERTGTHAAWGEQSVRGMVRILSIHDKMHAKELLERRA